MIQHGSNAGLESLKLSENDEECQNRRGAVTGNGTEDTLSETEQTRVEDEERPQYLAGDLDTGRFAHLDF